MQCTCAMASGHICRARTTWPELGAPCGPACARACMSLLRTCRRSTARLCTASCTAGCEVTQPRRCCPMHIATSGARCNQRCGWRSHVRRGGTQAEAAVSSWVPVRGSVRAQCSAGVPGSKHAAPPCGSHGAVQLPLQPLHAASRSHTCVTAAIERAGSRLAALRQPAAAA